MAAAVRAQLIREFGVSAPDSASVTFLGLEPIEVLRFAGDPVCYATVGCARHPMTDPADILADPTHGPRAELVLRLRAGADLVGLHRSLAVLAALPAVEGVVLRPDALLDLGEPVWRGAPFTAMLTGRSGLAEVSLPSPLDPVQLLEVVPITATEAAWVRLEGVPALREAWAEAGIDVRDPSRGMARR